MDSETGEVEKLLVSLLAHERALFRPFRGYDWSTPGTTAARTEMQAEFREKGLRWPQVGTAAQRMAAGRRLGEIVASGLIEATGPKGRRTHLRLTDRGRQVAEKLSGVPNLTNARRAVLTLLRFASAGELVSELLPAGLKNFSEENYQEHLYYFQSLAVPGIIAGWIEVFSDCHGRAAYRVTPAGVEAARQPKPTTPGGDPNATFADPFLYEYENERIRLLCEKPSHRNDIGPIPLSAGLWSEVVGPWNWKSRAKRRKTEIPSDG